MLVLNGQNNEVARAITVSMTFGVQPTAPSDMKSVANDAVSSPKLDPWLNVNNPLENPSKGAV